MHDYDKSNKALILKPVVISRSNMEKCLIEGSVNSVRISLKIKQNDNMDRLISKKFSDFFTSRADMFEILRKEAIEGYDVSFLITNDILEKYKKDEVIEFILDVNSLNFQPFIFISMLKRFKKI